MGLWQAFGQGCLGGGRRRAGYLQIKAIVEALEPRVLLSGLTGTGTSIQAIAGVLLDAGDIDGSGSIYVPAGVSVAVDEVNEGSLDIAGQLTLSSADSPTNRSRTSTVDSLTISGSGVLDVGDNKLIIDYGNGGNGGGSDSVSTIRSYLISGRNGGGWNGMGIISSSAQTPTFGHYYALGYADEADGKISGLASGQIEIMYTLMGDANLDGNVNGTDFAMTGNFGASVTGWDEGDFDYTGVFNGSDFSAQGANFGLGSVVWPAGSYTVPPQYVATFTDAANTPLSDLTASIDWGDSSTPTTGAIVSDGNGTFHVLANHVYGQTGTYQVTTTITDSSSNSTTEVESTAVVSPAALTATPLDAYDIQVLWPALPILNSGETLLISTDPNFQTNVTTENLSAGVTDFVASNLSPSTAYYFELLPAGTGMPAVGFTSAATDPSDGNGGTEGPTAPAITQAATSSQPTNTTLSLTMTAVSGNDPIDYSWQLISGPGGPAPEFTNSEQTTDVILSAAGNYDFRCTATDGDTGLSVGSDVSVDVNQVATSVSVSPELATIAVGGFLQYSAVQNDQFGDPMLSQPTFTWTTALPNTITSGELSDPDGPGIENVYAWGGNLVGVATFVAEGNYTPNTVARIGSNQNLYFSPPAYDMSFEVDTISSVSGEIEIYQGGEFSTELSVVPGEQVDLSQYPDITEIRADTSTPVPFIDNLTWAPELLSITLGNDTEDQVLQGSSSGTMDMVPLNLVVPGGPVDGSGTLPDGTQITLSTSAPNEVDVWNSDDPQSVDTPLLGGSGQTSSVTWTVGTDTIPSTLWVGATQGSASLGDIVFTLAIMAPGSSTPVTQASTQPATAVKVQIIAENDPNNAGIQGNDIAGQTNNWMVGQMVELQAQVQGPAAWLNNLKYNWSVPGNTLMEWNQSGSTASNVPLQANFATNNTGTQDQSIQFFWLTTGGDFGSATNQQIGIRVTLGNGTVASQSTTFKVYSPTASIVSAAPYFGAFQVDVPTSQIDAVDVTPHATFISDIFQSVSVQQPSVFAQAGNWSYLQMVKANDEEDHWSDGFNPYQTWASSVNGQWVLDSPSGSFPYNPPPTSPIWDDAALAPVANAMLSTGASIYDWTDNGSSSYALPIPGTTLSANEIVRNDLYSLYIMYQPVGANSQWIPLGVLQWSASFDAKDGAGPTGGWGFVGAAPTITAPIGWAAPTGEPVYATNYQSAPWQLTYIAGSGT